MGTGLSSLQLKKQLEDSLRKSKAVRLAGAGSKPKNGFVVELAVGMRRMKPLRTRKQGIVQRAQLVLSCQLSPVKPGNASKVIEEQKLLAYTRIQPPSPTQLQQILMRLRKELAYSIKVFAMLRQLPTKKLLEQLDTTPDDITRRHLAFLLGQRRTRKAVPGLIKLLQSKNKQVLVATVGALVKLKDKRAAIPLIQSATHQDVMYTRQVVSALTEIGGVDAQSYLFTLSSAHPNRSVQQSAKEGLEEIKQRQGTARP